MNKKNHIFIIAIIILIAIISILIINNLNKGELIKLNYNEITKKIDNQEDFILVVSKSTCSHCATYKPKLKKIAKDYKIKIYYIDYDNESQENQDKLLKNLNLDGSTPITLFIKEGKETSVLNRLEGDLSSTKVIEKFKKMGFITQ